MNSKIAFRRSSYSITPRAILLGAAIALSSLLSSTQARDEVPFRAVFATHGEAVPVPPNLHITIEGVGQAVHMGRTTVLTTDQVLNLVTLHATATYTLTAANGDTLKMFVELDYTVSATGFIAEGEFTVIQGTGRFLEATGGGTATLAGTFAEASSAEGVLIFEGSISKTGGH